MKTAGAESGASRYGGGSREDGASILAQSFALTVAIGAAFLGGAPPAHVHVLIVLAIGLLLVAFPPRGLPPRGLLIVAGAFLVCCALAYLPLFDGLRPGWRARFEDHLGLALGGCWSPQPGVTGECLLLALPVVLFGLWLLSHPISMRWHLRLAAAFVFAGGVYAALSIGLVGGGIQFPFDPVPTFGLFPNRNHAASLLAMCGILGIGVVAQGILDRRWICALLGAIGTCPVALGLLAYNDSRAGILLIFGGAFTWVLGLAGGRVSGRVIVSALAIGAAVATLFLVANTPARKRMGNWFDQLLELSAPPPEPALAPDTGAPDDLPPIVRVATSEARFQIYQDALSMMRDAPLTGVGLGNFRHVFSQYRARSFGEELCLHPESSWFLLGTEAGALACLAVLAAIVLLLLRLRGATQRPSWPLRWATAIAALVPAVHGLVDVPAHRTGVLLPALFLCGLAFRAKGSYGHRARRERAEPGPIPDTPGPAPAPAIRGARLALAARIPGAVALVCALFLARPLLDPGTPASVFQLPDLPARMLERREAGDMDRAFALIENALHRAPLDPGLRYWLGALYAGYQESEEQVSREFALQAALEPAWPGVPLQQAAIWVQIDKARAIPALRDAVTRAERIERTRPTPGDRHLWNAFYAALRIAGTDPALRAALLDAARPHPALLLQWLRSAQPAQFEEERARITTDATRFQALGSREQSQLLALWEQRGDRDALAAFLDAHPDLGDVAWAARMGLWWRAGRHEDVVRKSAERAGVSLDLGPPEERVSLSALEDAHEKFGSPLEVERLATRLLQMDRPDRALELLRAATSRRDATPELHRLQAIAEIRSQRWPAAWSCLQRHLRAIGSPLFP